MESHCAEKDDRFATLKTVYAEFCCHWKQTLFNQNRFFGMRIVELVMLHLMVYIALSIERI